jgi:hypothetical protein
MLLAVAAGKLNAGAFSPSKFAMHTSSGFVLHFAYHTAGALIKLNATPLAFVVDF